MVKDCGGSWQYASFQLREPRCPLTAAGRCLRVWSRTIVVLVIMGLARQDTRQTGQMGWLVARCCRANLTALGVRGLGVLVGRMVAWITAWTARTLALARS